MISAPFVIAYTVGVLTGLGIRAHRAYLHGRDDERARIERWLTRRDAPRSLR